MAGTLVRVKFFLFFVYLLICSGVSAQSLDGYPVASADTSSPRATLRSFVTAVDMGLTVELKAILSYLESDRLYSNDSENRLKENSDRVFAQALDTLDLSGLPPGFRGVLAVEQVIRLSEILARLDIPDFETIPDNEMMKARGEKRWTIPGTRIEISLIEEGPRQGEYLFSAWTVVNLAVFHRRMAEMSYKPSAPQRFVEGVRPYTSGRTLYDIYRYSTMGHEIIPARWMLDMPAWLTARFIGVATWQWLGLVMYVVLGVLIVGLVWFACRKIGCSQQWGLFISSVVVVVFAGLITWQCAQLHISGAVLYVTGISSVAVVYLVAAWAAFIGAGAIAETVVNVQNLRVRSIDSQLIRLGARLIGLLIAVALLVEGADELGLPAYSVLTGLGISGLAFAFAARETLANLLGSIVIMFEKPFRGGDWIKVGEAEGTVEYVGFRSTRIRTFEDSLISIPNSFVVNAIVDNFGKRNRRRQRFFIQIIYATPLDKLETFVTGIRRIIANHAMTDKEDVYIHLNNFGESSLDILLYYFLRVPDFSTEMREREVIMLEILKLATEVAVEFAFPTQTLQFDDRSTGSDQGDFHSPAGELKRT
jgi:MscS family membrane protein